MRSRVPESFSWYLFPFVTCPAWHSKQGPTVEPLPTPTPRKALKSKRFVQELGSRRSPLSAVPIHAAVTAQITPNKNPPTAGPYAISPSTLGSHSIAACPLGAAPYGAPPTVSRHNSILYRAGSGAYTLPTAIYLGRVVHCATVLTVSLVNYSPALQSE